MGQPIRNISDDRNTKPLYRDHTDETNVRPAPQYIARDVSDERQHMTKSTTRHNEPPIKNE